MVDTNDALDIANKGLNGVAKLANLNKSVGIENTNQSLLQWIVVFLIVVLVAFLISSLTQARVKDKTLTADMHTFFTKMDHFSEAINANNLILTRNLDSMDQVKNDVLNLAVKTDASIGKVHDRMNLIGVTVEVIKSNTDVCLKGG